jgi:RimJ/RimL family protein N-acetyltransferase
MTDTLRFIIRDGIPDDIPRCLALDHSYETEYVWQVSIQTDSHQQTIVLREERLPRQMDAVYAQSEPRLRHALQPDQCLLVAALEDTPQTPLGYLTMSPDPTAHTARLRDVVVGRDYRRQGVGLRLMSIAQRWALAHNIERIIAETQTKNYPAIALCRRAGYAFCGFNDQYFINRDIAVFFCLSLH